MNSSVKEKTISGILWSFVEKFGSIALQFVTNIVLARLLLPSDFGLLGLIIVFISLSNTFIDAGLGAALVQKKDASKEDFSTIFYVNILLALFLISLIYVFSGSIASFYEEVQLQLLLRVLSLVLLFNALSIIQNSLLIKEVNFKKLAFVNVLSTFIASVISISAALYGLGVWSLVIQMLGISFFKSFFLWISSKWKPALTFNFKSALKLIDFGYKLLISSLIDSLYVGLHSLVIGKLFTSSDLGYYTQAKKMQEAPGYTLSSVVNQVTFPIFVMLNDDFQAMKRGVKNSVISLAYLNFPIMVLLIVIAQPLFVLLLTHKWDQAIPYFQMFCIGSMLLTTHSVNLNILKALGKTNKYLLSEILKKVVGVVLLIIGYQMGGIIGIILSMVVTAYISFFINASFSGKAINYGITEQMLDLLPAFLLSILTGLAIYWLFSFVVLGLFAKILYQLGAYILIYVAISKIIGLRGYLTYSRILKEKFLKKNKDITLI